MAKSDQQITVKLEPSLSPHIVDKLKYMKMDTSSYTITEEPLVCTINNDHERFDVLRGLDEPISRQNDTECYNEVDEQRDNSYLKKTCGYNVNTDEVKVESVLGESQCEQGQSRPTCDTVFPARHNSTPSGEGCVTILVTHALPIGVGNEIFEHAEVKREIHGSSDVEIGFAPSYSEMSMQSLTEICYGNTGEPTVNDVKDTGLCLTEKGEESTETIPLSTTDHFLSMSLETVMSAIHKHEAQESSADQKHKVCKLIASDNMQIESYKARYEEVRSKLLDKLIKYRERNCETDRPSSNTTVHDTEDADKQTAQKGIQKKSDQASKELFKTNPNETCEFPFWCEICGKGFKQASNKKTHAAVHTDARPYTCDLCGLTFKLRATMVDHIAAHVEDVVKCEQCNIVFNGKKKLANHMSQVHQDRKHKCPHCDKTCKTNSHLREHSVVHTKVHVKAFQCEICHKKFSSKGYLKRHSVIHTDRDTKPFKCSICDYASSEAGNLRRHGRIHSQNSYQCQQCPKVLTNRDSFLRHLRFEHTHPEDKIKCDICGKKFASFNRFEYHMRRHFDDREFPCGVCGKRFKTQIDVRMHAKYHQPQEAAKCEICKSSYKRIGSLTRHMRQAHPRAPFI